MGTPNEKAAASESLDTLLHRLVKMVAGNHDDRPPGADHAETVEESVRRIEDGIPPEKG